TSLATETAVQLHVYGIHAHTLQPGERPSGTVIVGATSITGQFLNDPASYHWLLRYPHSQMLNHSIFVFHVPSSQPQNPSLTGPVLPKSKPERRTASAR